MRELVSIKGSEVTSVSPIARAIDIRKVGVDERNRYRQLRAGLFSN